MQAAWPSVDSQPLIWGWHNDAIVEHLEAVTRGHIRKLLINVPPGATKTISVQIMWPSWEWICNQHPRTEHNPTGLRPDLRYIYSTYSEQLALDKALEHRRLLESEWYQERFGDRWQPSPDQWGQAKFSNQQGGWRLATSVGGIATGQHADRKVLDDPIKPQDVLAGTVGTKKWALDNAWTFWTQTMGLRNTGPNTKEIVIMQRIHERDVAGRCIAEFPDYELLVIPQRFESKHPYVRRTVLERDIDGEPVRTWQDPRTDEGELMCPERFPPADVERRAKILGSQGWAAQEQQRPSPAGGSMYHREQFKHWSIVPSEGTWVISGDCTFKALDNSDWVVLQVWCARGPDFYLIDQVRDRIDVLGTCSAIQSLRAKWTRVGAILIEDAANGPAVTQIMSKSLPGMKLVRPLGGKIARANASAVYHESGNVYLPLPQRAPWVHDYIEEHVGFPFGGNDDQVDAQSQAINHLAMQAADYEAMLATMRNLGVAD